MSFFRHKQTMPQELIPRLRKYRAIREGWIQDLKGYQATVIKSPRNVEAQFNVALTLILLERYEEALATYHAVLHIQNTNTSALYGCARVLVSLNRAEEAQEMNEQLLKIKPQDTGALTLENLIQTHLEKEQEQKKAMPCRCLSA